MKTKAKTQVKPLVLLFALVFLALIYSCSFAIAAEKKVADKNNPTEKDNTPIFPIVVGGLIGIVGSIGGGSIIFMLQSRHEGRVFKRSKLEELSTLAYQCDDWLDQLILSYLVQGEISAVIEKFPVNRIKMIQALYFPSLKGEVQTLAASVKEFREMAILERPNLKATHKYSSNFQKRFDPKQKAVLRAIEDLMEKASAIKI
jgi:hypothetical protein